MPICIASPCPATTGIPTSGRWRRRPSTTSSTDETRPRLYGDAALCFNRLLTHRSWNMADRRLQVFHAVAKHLSFTKAADALFMTQPAVTFQIKQLEEHYNT